MPIISTLSNLILSITGRCQSSRESHAPVDMASLKVDTVFTVKRQSPSEHLKVLRNSSASIEDKLEFLAPTLHNASNAYVEFLQKRLDAHIKTREAQKLAEQRFADGQEVEWPKCTKGDLDFGHTITDYAGGYLIFHKDTFANMDKALSKWKADEQEFECKVAERMRTQGWSLSPSEEWKLIKKAMDEEAPGAAAREVEAVKTAIKREEAASLKEMAESTKGQTFASENVFYEADQVSDEDEGDNDDYDHIYSYPDPPGGSIRGTVNPEEQHRLEQSSSVDKDGLEPETPLSITTKTPLVSSKISCIYQPDYHNHQGNLTRRDQIREEAIATFESAWIHFQPASRLVSCSWYFCCPLPEPNPLSLPILRVTTPEGVSYGLRELLPTLPWYFEDYVRERDVAQPDVQRQLEWHKMVAENDQLLRIEHEDFRRGLEVYAEVVDESKQLVLASTVKGSSYAFDWADDAIDVAENGDPYHLAEGEEYDAVSYGKEEAGDGQLSEEGGYDADSDPDSSSEGDMQISYPLQRLRQPWVPRSISFVAPKLETIFEEDEERYENEESIYDHESEDDMGITNHQPKRRASDPEEYAKIYLEEFHQFLAQNNQKPVELYLPSISQQVEPLLRETFALDYEEESESDITDDGIPPRSLIFEAPSDAAGETSTTPEVECTRSPAQLRKVAFLSSLYQAKKDVREEMKRNVMETIESEARGREELYKEHQKSYQFKISKALISLRFRMTTFENLIQNGSNPLLFKRSPVAAANGAEEVLFVGKELLKMLTEDHELGLIDRAVALLKKEGTWMAYEKVDYMEAVRKSYSKKLLLPVAALRWTEMRWVAERKFVRTIHGKQSKCEDSQMEIVGEVFTRVSKGEGGKF